MTKKKDGDAQVDELLTSINTAFKDSDFSIATEKDFISKLDWLSSGNYAINYSCTGDPVKAIPFGRITSLIGDSGSGKSLLADHFIAETQRIGGLAVLFDVERAGYVNQMEKLGIDTKKLIVSGSKVLEDIFEKTIFFIKSFEEKKLDIPLTIVIDSISQASSRAEVEEGFEKADMKRAQVIRKGLRMVSGLISDNKVCLIIVNHQTQNIGNPYGPAKVMTGGTAVEYFPSQIIEVNKGKVIKDSKDMPIGMEIRVKIFKSRFHTPYITARVQVYFGKGLDPISGLFDIMINLDILKDHKGWYAFKDNPDKKYRESEVKDMLLKDMDTYLKMFPIGELMAVGIDGA